MRLRILFLFSIIIVSSCSTTTKISVAATPGTEIMTPDKRVLAVADESGRAEFINDDENYFSFLYTHEKGSSMYIPFALDYKHKKYGTRTAAWIDYGVMFVGVIGGLANMNNDTPRMIFGGVSLAALGAFFPLLAKGGQTNELYQYKYLPLQNSNQDLQFAPIGYYPSNSVQKSSSNNSSTESVNIDAEHIGEFKDDKYSEQETHSSTDSFGNTIPNKFLGMKLGISSKQDCIRMIEQKGYTESVISIEDNNTIAINQRFFIKIDRNDSSNLVDSSDGTFVSNVIFGFSKSTGLLISIHFSILPKEGYTDEVKERIWMWLYGMGEVFGWKETTYPDSFISYHDADNVVYAKLWKMKDYDFVEIAFKCK